MEGVKTELFMLSSNGPIRFWFATRLHIGDKLRFGLYGATTGLRN